MKRTISAAHVINQLFEEETMPQPIEYQEDGWTVRLEPHPERPDKLRVLLNGRWYRNGIGAFKTVEKAKAEATKLIAWRNESSAKAIAMQNNAAANMDARVADEFFKHAKKSGY